MREDIKLLPMIQFKEYKSIQSFVSFDFGAFVWDYNANAVYVNEFMEYQFSIDFTNNLGVFDLLLSRLEDFSVHEFYESIKKLKVNKGKRDTDFKVKGRKTFNWYKLNMKYDENLNATIGFISVIHEKDDNIASMTKSKDIFEIIVQRIGVPVFLTNEINTQQFTNFEMDVVHSHIYKKIDAIINHEDIDFNDVKDVRLMRSGSSESEFRVKYTVNNAIREERIIRTEIMNKDQMYILYRHEKLYDSFTEQVRLRKILQANELMMEINNSIDNIDDINQMFDYLLSKISSVIPEANRSCILKRDDNDMLYLANSYGFHNVYVETFKLPFKDSFAFMHLQNDYSKSVIINDIQRKYSDLFPDIKNDNTKDNIESNIAVPIVIEDSLYGLVSVDSNMNRVFDDVDLYLLDYMKIQIERSIEKFRKLSTIKKDSNEDSLTGVSNRRYFLDMLEYTKEKANREGKAFYFVLFDIDGLKKINDTHGHIGGDMVLKQFAFVIDNRIRETDIFARIGGDEFAGLFYNVDKEILTSRILEWRNYFEMNNIEYKGHQIQTAFSFGISKYNDDGVSFKELVEAADTTLYKQKKKRKEQMKNAEQD